MGRKQAREGAVKLMFQMDSTNDYSLDALEVFLNNFEFDENETKYIKESYDSIKINLEAIDKNIIDNLEGWSLPRLAKVDLAALRVAINEIMYRNDIPIQVAINEAVEIVKLYSNEDSFKFVNGVLGGYVRKLNKNE